MASADEINYYLTAYSQWLGGPDNLLQAIAEKESSYNPFTGQFRNVCNSQQACGLMQLRPNAIADIYRVFKFKIDPMNPLDAALGAALLFYLNALYLQRYIGEWPDLATLIVAYNGGWRAGWYYYAGYEPSNEGKNYLAYVSGRIGIA